MEERADAFIALPGGFGTLEELLEIITLKQLKYHLKPVVVMNFLHYYDSLRELFDHVIREKFAIADSRSLYYFTEDPRDAIDYIENYHFEGISPQVAAVTTGHAAGNDATCHPRKNTALGIHTQK